MENGRLSELLWERRGSLNIVGNIYKATVENVLPGISSAFVNIGYEKNAYLYISDVLGGDKDPIDRLIKKNQEILVQVVKDAIGTKGMAADLEARVDTGEASPRDIYGFFTANGFGGTYAEFLTLWNSCFTEITPMTRLVAVRLATGFSSCSCEAAGDTAVPVSAAHNSIAARDNFRID